MFTLSHRVGVLTVIVILLTAVTPGSGQLPPLDELMQQKLDHTQRLLEAVVLRQHITVERDARASASERRHDVDEPPERRVHALRLRLPGHCTGAGGVSASWR